MCNEILSTLQQSLTSAAGGAPILHSRDASLQQNESAPGAGFAGGTFHDWLLGMLPQLIYVRSADGALLYANKAGAEAAGVTPGAVIEAWQVTPAALLNANEMGLPGV